MTNHDELLRRVAAHARSRSRTLPPAAGPDDVAGAERRLGFTLPVLLRRLYTEVANGGFGPDYCLFPLTGEGRTATSAYRAEYGPGQEGGPSAHWPRGVLPILDWGCAMYAAVDCLRPGAPVLLFEPNAGPEDWADAWFEDSPSLAAWLEAWLSGTGWWEEAVMFADDAAEPRPWPDAASRIREGS
ncbi:SMI1/KNR4 family protein [Kitasatospora sp. NPDC052896]|uniref:SMI1/KNR4 family protein n=1 Tax=Kitasatospora sp. NPDC052896 TaxID=3364061 RepID=UPI0037C875CC